MIEHQAAPNWSAPGRAMRPATALSCEIHQFAAAFEAQNCQALSLGIGLGTLKPRLAPEILAARLPQMPARLQVDAPHPQREDTTSLHAKPLAPVIIPPRRSLPKVVGAWGLDLLVMATCVSAVLIGIYLFFSIKSGLPQHPRQIPVWLWMVNLPPFKLLIGFNFLLFLYAVIFKTLVGYTPGESLLGLGRRGVNPATRPIPPWRS